MKKSFVTITKKAISAPTPLLDRFEKQTIWHIALLVLLPFFVYIKVVDFEFINMDDASIIVNNFDVLTNFHNVGLAFKTDAFIALHGDFYRPVQTVSFFVDAFFGGEKPWIYHFSNLILHICTVISFYFLLRTLLIKNLTAFFFALIFSIHPLLSAAVSWVPARGDLLMALFGMLSFITFINYCRVKEIRWKVIYFLLHTLLFILTIFSKEVSLVFPALLLFYYFFIYSEKINLKEFLPPVIIWGLIIAFFFILRNKVVIGTPPPFILGITPFFQDLPAIPIILAKLFIPANLSTMPLFESIFTIGGSILLILFVFIIVRSAFKKQWVAVMGFVWFILFVTPPLFFKIFYSHFLIEYFEHRAYFPVAGILILLAFFLNNKIFRNTNRLLNFLPILVIILFAFLSSLNGDHFKDSIAFFSRATDLGNAGACTKRGEMYFEQRDFQNALNDFNKAIDLSDNEYPPAFYDRGKVESSTRKDDSAHIAAEQDFTQTIALDSTYIDAYIERANERIFTKNVAGAFADLDKAKQLDSSNSRIYFTLGSVYVNTSDFRNAVTGFSKAISLNNGDAEAYNDRAYALYRLQDYDSALHDCQRAIGLFPQFMNAYYNKGMIYLQLNKPDVAVKTFDTALALTNNFYFGYFYRGMAKKQLKDMKGACDDWQQAVKLGFTMAQDTINKYCK